MAELDLTASLTNPAERRKQVRLTVRPDLQSYEQRYEGKVFHVVKDPVCLRYYRFNKQEYFVFQLFDGRHTLDEVQKKFEKEFTPLRLTHEDLEAFARQLVTAGLVQHELPGTGKHIFNRRAKQRRLKRLATLSNILYLKIPVFDPDRLLTWMYRYLWWIFTWPFLIASVLFMLAALFHVLLHFDTFYAKLPAYHEFFAYHTLLYMWISLGVVKIIHEFGHGLSCKAFGGECHEMGLLLMCLSPAMYCNVTDAWTLSDKWKRIIISFAGIYVELIIAAIATFVWWYTPAYPFVNNLALCIMVLCSISTVIFNANPLMRFDGYYILADWLEIPNLREKSNRFLNNLFLEKCLGIEVPPEGYMAPGRRVLFVTYAIASWVYKWVILLGVIFFISDFLTPKLKIISQMLAALSLVSLFIWPIYRVVRNIRQRGRLPDMKAGRVYVTLGVVASLIAAFFLLPLPVSRVSETGYVTLDPGHVEGVLLPEPARLESVEVKAGQFVRQGEVLARFSNADLAWERDRLLGQAKERREAARQLTITLAEINQLDPDKAFLYEEKRREAEIEAANAERLAATLEQRLNRILTLKAPRDGYVTNVPSKDHIGRVFDRGSTDQPAICSVGDVTRLIVKVPVSPQEFRVLQDDLASEEAQARGGLRASVHFQGRSDRVFEGIVRSLPSQNAATVPLQLTQRGGGPLAVKPSEDPNVLQPLAQTYLVDVEVTDADAATRPGGFARVLIHTRWRSAAWWIGRIIANALDIGLY